MPERKETKDRALYSFAATAGVNCATCRHMQVGGGCDLVEGSVDSAHVCAYHSF